MGAYYRDVPANTRNGDFAEAFLLCPNTFNASEFREKCRLEGKISILDQDPDGYSNLTPFIDALSFTTQVLLDHHNVYSIRGYACSISYNSAAECGAHASELSENWEVEINLGKYSSSKNPSLGTTTVKGFSVIMAVGAEPIYPAGLSPTFKAQPLDEYVNPTRVIQHFEEAPHLKFMNWAVVGSSHSAMLVVKNLHEAGVVKITNFYRSSFRFNHVTDEGWSR